MVGFRLWIWMCCLSIGTNVLAQGEIRGVISNEDGGAPLAGAQVLVLGAQKSASSGRDGTYSVTVPEGTYQVLVTAPGFEAHEQSISLASGQIINRDFVMRPTMVQFGQEIVVLGSRASRTAVESPVPIDVLGKAEIKTAALQETSRILQFLAPSFNFPTSTISDGTDIVRPSTLRGLGPDQTLVLVNGKRRHNTALVHVNGSVGRGPAPNCGVACR